MNTQNILNKLIQKENLSTDESHALLVEIMKGTVNQSRIAAILTALRMKGETSEEIIGFIQAMRQNMVKVYAENAIDVCGTGGDGKGTFNISTAVAFVVAGCGVQVVKHGNKAASSKCGSADVLQQLGVKIDVQPAQAEKLLENRGMVFLFAPLYHPSFTYVAAVRKELGIRTIFNFLGPFANPASVKRQLVGVPNLDVAEKLSQVAKTLGYAHLCIVSSDDGIDEVGLTSKTHIFEIKENKVTRSIIEPEDFGLKKSSLKELQGGDVKQNAKIIQQVLNGQKGAKRDIVIFNSALALYIAGKVKNIQEGIILAEKSIDTGNAKEVLENLVKETQKYA